MIETLFPALLIDLEATTVRFAFASASPTQMDSRHYGNVIERPVSNFDEAPLMAKAVRWALRQFDIHDVNIDVLISVAAPALGDNIALPKPAAWSFGKVGLAEQLRELGVPVRRVEVVNDMFACGLSLPDLLAEEEYIVLGKSSPAQVEGYPVLLACARPNLGASGLAPVPYISDDSVNPIPIWAPVQAEPGAMSLSPLLPKKPSNFSDSYVDLLQKLNIELPFSYDGLRTAHDFLSPRGIKNIYDILTSGDDQPKIEGLASSPVSRVADELMQVWSAMFGVWLRSLALAWGARGGIYITGVTPRAFFQGDNAEKNRKIFRTNFEARGPIEGYLNEIPTYLLTHPDPFIKGLRRLQKP